MSFRVVVTDTAKQDLREIAIWIAEESKDVDVAKKFAMELRAEIGKLADFPKAGAVPKDRVLLSADFRYLVYKEYLIFYSVDEKTETVSVLAVFNEKKDYMRVMRKLI